MLTRNTICTLVRPTAARLCVFNKTQNAYTRRRLAVHPQAVNAIIQPARDGRRSPDTVTTRDIVAWSSSS